MSSIIKFFSGDGGQFQMGTRPECQKNSNRSTVIQAACSEMFFLNWTVYMPTRVSCGTVNPALKPYGGKVSGMCGDVQVPL